MTSKQAVVELFSPLLRELGHPLTRFERTHYELPGGISERNGDVQLTFGSRTVHLAGAANGASLIVNDIPWADPFAGPLDEETRAFLEKAGRWVLVDVSAMHPNARVIGVELTEFFPIVDDAEFCSGVQLWFEEEAFSVIVDGDEVELVWGRDLLPGHRLLWAGVP